MLETSSVRTLSSYQTLRHSFDQWDCTVLEYKNPGSLERIDLSSLQSLHTFCVSINFSVSLLLQEPDFARWLAKSLRDLPLTHSLKTLIFDVISLGPSDLSQSDEWFDLDQTLCSTRRQVNSVFSFRERYSEEDVANLCRFINSAFPLSTKMGLISFAWRGDW